MSAGLSLFLTYDDGAREVVMRVNLPTKEKRLSSIARAFAKSYAFKHQRHIDAAAIRFQRGTGAAITSGPTRVGTVFADGDRVAVSWPESAPESAASPAAPAPARPVTPAAPEVSAACPPPPLDRPSVEPLPVGVWERPASPPSSPARRAPPPAEETAEPRARAPAVPGSPRRELGEALDLKDQANALFRTARVGAAVTLYGRALDALGSPRDSAEASLRVTLLNNRALCRLRTQMYKEARMDCDESLSLAATSKAFYLRARARLEVDRTESDAACADLAALLASAGDAAALNKARADTASVAAKYFYGAAFVDDDAMAALRSSASLLAGHARRRKQRGLERFADPAAAQADPPLTADADDRVLRNLDEEAFNVGVDGRGGVATLTRATNLQFKVECLTALGELHFRRGRYRVAADVFRCAADAASTAVEASALLDLRLASAEASPVEAAEPFLRRALVGRGAALERAADRSDKAAVERAAWLGKCARELRSRAPPLATARRFFPEERAAVGVVLCHGWGCAGEDLAPSAALLAEALAGLGLRARISVGINRRSTAGPGYL